MDRTNVLIDHELKKMAKNRGINISKTLNEALRVKLSLNVDQVASIAQLKSDLTAQLAFLESEEAKLEEEKKKEEYKEEEKRRENDINLLRQSRIQWLNNPKYDKFHDTLRTFCKKYNMPVNQAMLIAESRKVTA